MKKRVQDRGRGNMIGWSNKRDGKRGKEINVLKG
jgi:hypothetical protein